MGLPPATQVDINNTLEESKAIRAREWRCRPLLLRRAIDPERSCMESIDRYHCAREWQCRPLLLQRVLDDNMNNNNVQLEQHDNNDDTLSRM